MRCQVVDTSRPSSLIQSQEIFFEDQIVEKIKWAASLRRCVPVVSSTVIVGQVGCKVKIWCAINENYDRCM